MPRYTKEREQLEAKKVVKDLLKHGSGTAIARARGTTRQNECRKLRSKPVVDTLQRFLDSKKLDKTLIKVAKEGLEAMRVVGYLNNKVDGVQKVSDDFVETPDMNVRYKFWNGLMMAKGKIKQNGQSSGIKVVNIVYGYRSKDDSNSAIRPEIARPSVSS